MILLNREKRMTDAERVLDFYKRHYWPGKGRCHQPMAIQQSGGLSSTVAEAGVIALLTDGLLEPGPRGGYCLTDAGLRAIGVMP